MKRRAFVMAAVVGLAFLSIARPAQAEPDSFGLGGGFNGTLAVTSTVTLNDYAPIVADTGLTGTTVTIGPLAATGGPGLAPGNLVMVWQTTGLAALSAPSGNPTSIPLNGQAGSYEYARIDSINGSDVTLTHPLVNEYAATGAQLIRVPEYTFVTVAETGGITAYPWDGSSGGIVVLFAAEGVITAGPIEANAAGFRGGIDEPGVTSVSGCTALDGPVVAGGPTGGGAHKGEGLVPSAFSVGTGAAMSAYGYGNVASGGGGGDCLEASGGGGGNGGAGGHGGESQDGNRAVGGYGGAPVAFAPSDHLSLGGGGGAGSDLSGGPSSAVGAAGGGVVLIRALGLNPASTTVGSVEALGGTPPEVFPAAAQWLSAGGGGAGGTIVLQLTSGGACAPVDASGGNGGIASNTLSASFGGGGGGGFILSEATGSWCVLQANGGRGGDELPGLGLGEAPGAPGVINATPTGFVPPPCSFEVGGCGGCTTNAATSMCPTAFPICIESVHTCAECGSDADCVDSVYGGVCGAGNLCGVCNATENVCSGANPACDTTGSRSTCVPCNGDLGTTATNPCPSAAHPYCEVSGSCSTCGAEGETSACVTVGNGIVRGGPVCGASGACGTTCAGDLDCATAGYCDSATHTCQPLLPGGAACERPAECASNECTAGRCGGGAKDAGADTSTSYSIDAAIVDAHVGAKSDAGHADAGHVVHVDAGRGLPPSKAIDGGGDSGGTSPTSNSAGCSCKSVPTRETRAFRCSQA